MNKIIIGLLTISLATNAYLLFKPKEVVVTELEPEKVVVQEKELIKDLELEKKYQAALLEIASLNNLLKNAETNDTEVSITPEEVAKNELKEQIITEGYKKHLSNQSKKGMEAFYSEPVDPIWSHKVTSAIQAVINTEVEHDKYSLSNIECKSTTCRMSIRSYEADGTNNIQLAQVATMNFSPSNHPDMPNFGTKYVQNEKTGDVTVYFWQSK